jgi:hypothetical protein
MKYSFFMCLLLGLYFSGCRYSTAKIDEDQVYRDYVTTYNPQSKTLRHTAKFHEKGPKGKLLELGDDDTIHVDEKPLNKVEVTKSLGGGYYYLLEENIEDEKSAAKAFSFTLAPKDRDPVTDQVHLPQQAEIILYESFNPHTKEKEQEKQAKELEKTVLHEENKAHEGEKVEEDKDKQKKELAEIGAHDEDKVHEEGKDKVKEDKAEAKEDEKLKKSLPLLVGILRADEGPNFRQKILAELGHIVSKHNNKAPEEEKEEASKVKSAIAQKKDKKGKKEPVVEKPISNDQILVVLAGDLDTEGKPGIATQIIDADKHFCLFTPDQLKQIKKGKVYLYARRVVTKSIPANPKNKKALGGISKGIFYTSAKTLEFVD